jgi:L-glutamine-phosphate cytidylyltransferase
VTSAATPADQDRVAARRMPRLIVLAAGLGTRLRPITDDRPKALVPLAGRPLLEWTLDAARAAGIDDIVLVGGHRADLLDRYGLPVVVNADHATTNMVASLFCADDALVGDVIVAYGDIAFRPDILRSVVEAPGPIRVAVDLDWRGYWERRFADPLADAESLRMRPDGTIAEIGRHVDRIDEIEGQYIGLMGFREEGIVVLRAAWGQACADDAAGRPVFRRIDGLRRLFMTDILDEIAGATRLVGAVPIHGGWVEIDSHADLALAEELVAAGRLASTIPASAPGP